MKNTFKSKIAVGGEVLQGTKLAQAYYVARPHYLTTTLTVYGAMSDGDPFVVTLNNSLLGWRAEFTGTSLGECLEWLSESRLPAAPVAKIVAALAEKPQPKRGRPTKPKPMYCARKRRDGSEVTVTVGKVA